MWKLFSLLVGGTLLAACQSNPPKTQDQAVNQEALVKTDSAATASTAPADTVGLPAGSIPTIGSPKLLFTLDDAHNTPDGLALAPNGHLILSVPNLADNSQPAQLMKIDGTSVKPFANNLPVEPTTKKAAPMDLRNNNNVTTLAQNPDTDGSGGKLDQPAEVLLKGKRLYISDFDHPVKHFANTKSDAPHTMSVIELP